MNVPNVPADSPSGSGESKQSFREIYDIIQDDHAKREKFKEDYQEFKESQLDPLSVTPQIQDVDIDRQLQMTEMFEIMLALEKSQQEAASSTEELSINELLERVIRPNQEETTEVADPQGPQVIASQSTIPTPLGDFPTAGKQSPSGENPQEQEVTSIEPTTATHPDNQSGADPTGQKTQESTFRGETQDRWVKVPITEDPEWEVGDKVYVAHNFDRENTEGKSSNLEGKILTIIAVTSPEASLECVDGVGMLELQDKSGETFMIPDNEVMSDEPTIQETTFTEANMSNLIDAQENSPIPPLFPEDLAEEKVPDDAPLSPVKQKVVARLLEQQTKKILSETTVMEAGTGNPEIAPGGAEPSTGISEIAPEEEALFKAVSNRLSNEGGSIDSRKDKKQITDLVKSLEVIRDTNNKPIVISKETVESSLTTPASNDEVIEKLESAFKTREPPEFTDVEGYSALKVQALHEAMAADDTKPGEAGREKIKEFVDNHRVLLDEDNTVDPDSGNPKPKSEGGIARPRVVATSELMRAYPRLHHAVFTTVDNVTPHDRRGRFQADDSDSASLATHVRGLLICNKSTRNELQDKTKTQELIKEGLAPEAANAKDNSNFRELQSYVLAAKKENNRFTSNSRLRDCLDAYDKEQETTIKDAFEASKPNASDGDELTVTETESDKPTPNQVESLRTAIRTFNQQQAVKRHYLSLDGKQSEFKNEVFDIDEDKVFGSGGQLTDEYRQSPDLSDNFEDFCKEAPRKKSVLHLNDAAAAQAQLEAIEKNGNSLSSAIDEDLSNTQKGDGTWARKVQKESCERIKSSGTAKQLTTKGAGSSPWFMDLKGLRGHRYSMNVGEDGKMKIDVHTPTTKRMGFSTDYSSYAKSLFNAQHAGGLYGKNVTVTINDKDPAVVRRKIRALTNEAQKRGVPLSSITINTPNISSGSGKTLKQIVTDASNDQDPYGSTNFSFSNLNKSWAEGVLKEDKTSDPVSERLYQQKANLEDDSAQEDRRKQIIKDFEEVNAEPLSDFCKYEYNKTDKDVCENTADGTYTCALPVLSENADAFEKARHKRVLEEEIQKTEEKLKNAVDELNKDTKAEKKPKALSYSNPVKSAKLLKKVLEANNQLAALHDSYTESNHGELEPRAQEIQPSTYFDLEHPREPSDAGEKLIAELSKSNWMSSFTPRYKATLEKLSKNAKASVQGAEEMAEEMAEEIDRARTQPPEAQDEGPSPSGQAPTSHV